MKILCILINLIGGALVLTSYAYGLTHHKNSVQTLWGGVPDYLRIYYTIGIVAAALGYLFFSYYLLVHVDAQEARIFGFFNFNIFNFIYLLILVPSMFFIFLAFKMALFPSLLTWLSLRIILFLCAVGALLMLVALVGLTPRFSNWAYCIALIGSSLFFLHTFVLDAIIWPYFFKQ